MLKLPTHINLPQCGGDIEYRLWSHHRLIVSHSHSWGPAEPPTPFNMLVWLPDMLIMPVPIGVRWFMPKPLDDMPPGNPERPAEEPIGRAASLDPVDSGLSMSMLIGASAVMLLLCRRCRFEDTVAGLELEDAPGPGLVFGGAAAIGTTPLPPTAPAEEPEPPKWLFGVLPAVLPPDVGPLEGLSTSLMLEARLEAGGVVTLGGWLMLLVLLVLAVVDIESEEFLREAAALAFFLDLVLVPPTGKLDPEPRFLFLMTSVFKLNGRTTPCNFKNKPHALHNG